MLWSGILFFETTILVYLVLDRMNRIFFFVMIAAAVGCKKITLKEGEKRLPYATEIGRGIFACYLDEDTYIARRQEEITYNATTGYLFLSNSNRGFQFRLFVYEGIFGPGEYSFNATGEEWIVSDYYEWYGINPDGINELQITHLDLQSATISGRFDLDLINDDGREKSIREGRFDLKMNIIN